EHLPFSHIDRRLALSFGALILALMSVILVVGGLYYQKVMQREQDKLSTLVTQILANSVNRISFSGKYHARLLLEEIKAQQSGIAYVMVADKEGAVLAHSDPALNDSKLDAGAMQAAAQVLQGGEREIRNLTVAGEPIRDITLPYHAGFENKVAGVIRVGIADREGHAALAQGLFYLAALVLVLMAIGAGITLKLSANFGRPVKRLAAQLQGILEHAPLLIAIRDINGRVHSSSVMFRERYGLSPDDLRQKSVTQLLPPPAAQLIRETDGRIFARGETLRDEIRVELGGKEHTYLLTRFPIASDESGRTTLLCSIGLDVSEQKRMETALFKEKELAQITLQSIGDAVITTDKDSHVTYLNPIAEQLTGWTNADAVGQSLTEVFVILNEITRATVENPVEKALREKRVIGLANHTLLIARDGTEYAIEDSAAPIRDREGRIIGAVLVFHDVSRARDMTRQILFQATHDALTGLINRREFEHRLSNLLASAEKDERQHALLYLDLDQFKVVNDTCGHAAGDKLLGQLTQLLQTCIQEPNTLARLGGDEFGVLLQDATQEQALAQANVLMEAIKSFRFIWQDQFFVLGVSVGLVALSKENHDTVDSALIAADTACYLAKDMGRNRVQIFRHEDAELTNRSGQMHWVSRITRAIEKDRFRLYKQLIQPVGAETNGGRHWEILLRMVDEDGNIIAPGVFIPAAERYNLMPAVDRWVVQHALEAFRDLRAASPDWHDTFSINLSGASFSEDSLLRFIRETLHHCAVPPQDICFEITETAAIANMSRVIEFIDEMKALGCRFSLDDFGSGLSSFAYLKNFRVDYLKIDGAFVRDMVEDKMDHAMVEAIHHIGQVMGIRTVAEFVETDAILQKLTAIGVNYAQGYAIHRPEPLLPQN
ncbi:MAG: EAL domain-containing protein, partial [Sulfuricella sp.]